MMYDEMRGQVRGRGGERPDTYSNTYRKNLKCIANCPGDGVLLPLFGENKTRRPQDKDGKITERRKYNIIEHSKRGPKNRRRQSSLRKKKAAFNLFFIQSLSAEREREAVVVVVAAPMRALGGPGVWCSYAIGGNVTDDCCVPQNYDFGFGVHVGFPVGVAVVT